jgi:hypothetical protein
MDHGDTAVPSSSPGPATVKHGGVRPQPVDRGEVLALATEGQLQVGLALRHAHLQLALRGLYPNDLLLPVPDLLVEAEPTLLDLR